MEKNRLFIVIASAVAIISSFLPWMNVAGSLGGSTILGVRANGKFLLILATISLILAILGDRTKPLSKGSTIGIGVIGVLSSFFSLTGFNSAETALEQMDFFAFEKFVSMGFGLYLAIASSIALIVFAVLSFLSDKSEVSFSAESFDDIANKSKRFAQSVGKVASATVKTAVDEIKKETQAKAPEAPQAPVQPEQPVQPQAPEQAANENQE